jgi:hypothetical protein
MIIAWLHEKIYVILVQARKELLRHSRNAGSVLELIKRR